MDGRLSLLYAIEPALQFETRAQRPPLGSQQVAVEVPGVAARESSGTSVLSFRCG